MSTSTELSPETASISLSLIVHASYRKRKQAHLIEFKKNSISSLLNDDLLTLSNLLCIQYVAHGTCPAHHINKY